MGATIQDSGKRERSDCGLIHLQCHFFLYFSLILFYFIYIDGEHVKYLILSPLASILYGSV